MIKFAAAVAIGITIGASLVLFGAVVKTAIAEQEAFYQECTHRGGIVVKSNGRLVCIKAERL